MERLSPMLLTVVGLWTLVEAVWCWLAYRVTASEGRRPAAAASADGPTMSVFKPVPPGRSREETAALAEAIGSFVGQLDGRTELLLGIPDADHDAWAPYLRRWEREGAPGRLRVVVRPPPSAHANPKVAWERVLASVATGAVWLWSDADVVAPAGYLARARAEWAEEGGLLTHTYVITDVPRAAGVLEALFVNVEFHPGTLLLGRRRALRFGFGASLVFGADAFRRRVAWEALGAELAEDHALGRWLRPVRLGSDVLRTFAHSRRWLHGLGHYMRWQKTVRWCEPAGFAAQLLGLPLVGWAALAATAPATLAAWVGLAVVWQGEALFAWGLCRRVGCGIQGRWAPVVWAWPWVRVVTWLLCWLPWPVRWNGQSWWAPRRRRRTA